MKRRDFIKTTAFGTAAVTIGGAAGQQKVYAEESPRSTKKVPRRPFGKTGEELSIIGFGGVSMNGVAPDRVMELMEKSVEAGVNFVDLAPRYGNAETLAGPIVEPFRDQLFLACKTAKRTAREAREELERSLERLRTDHFDLYQMHNIQNVQNDVEVAFADGGVMEVLVEARKAGLVRYLGFSAHTEAAALRALELFDFDSVMLPINFVCEYEGNFGPRVIEKAREKECAIFALKPMVRQRGQGSSESRRRYGLWYEPLHEPELAALGLRWTLSKPGITSALPPGNPDLYELALELAKNYTPLTEEENSQVQAMAREYAPLFRA